MKKRADRIETYETGHEDFLVDVVDKYDRTAQEHVYEAWIYRESVGMKVMIYGVLAEKSGSFEGFCACLDDDLEEFYNMYDRKTERG